MNFANCSASWRRQPGPAITRRLAVDHPAVLSPRTPGMLRKLRGRLPAM